MNKKLRQERARRIRFVGCKFCGETNKPLRNFGDVKICTSCMEKQNVPKSGTGGIGHD